MALSLLGGPCAFTAGNLLDNAPRPGDLIGPEDFSPGSGRGLRCRSDLPLLRKENRPPMYRKGLGQEEALQRLSEEGRNVLPQDRPASPFLRLAKILTEPMFLLLLGGGGLYFLLGDRTEGLFLLSFVLVVMATTFFQKQKTDRALEALRNISSPHATVIRDGARVDIPSSDIVREDLLVLDEGNRVPADARLLEGRLETDESLLTGESLPVLKIPGQENLPFAVLREGTSPFVYAGTVVIHGSAVGKVEATGEKSAVGAIGRSLSGVTEKSSFLEKTSLRFVRTLSVAGVSLAAADVLINRFWIGKTFLESLLNGLALAMAVLPEEIPVILTIFLAIGAWRLSRIHILSRRLSAVETLGSITLLAVDKTGTLTENRMLLKLIVSDGETFETGQGSLLPETFHRTVEFALLSTPPNPFDPMEEALATFGRGSLEGTEHLHDSWTPVKVYGIEPPILAMARAYPTGSRREFLFATKGSPESILDLCHVPESRLSEMLSRVDTLAGQGYRVIGVAQGTWTSPDLPENLHDVPFTFLGLLAFQDPPRMDAAAAVRQCASAGIRILMMTGDHPATAKAIAREVGIPNSEVITGKEIDDSSDEVLQERLARVSVCARLRPEQKLRLVDLLKKNGEVVGVTGDGVNDAPALKSAQVGIAMGQQGTDVAREAASLVLLDNSFKSLVEGIRLGRLIFENLLSALRFALAVHLPLIALSLIPLIFRGTLLLTPVHIVLLQLIIDPACSLLFESEPARRDLMADPPRPPHRTPFEWASLRGALFQGTGVAGILLGGFFLFDSFRWTIETTRSILFFSLVLSVLLLILTNRTLRSGDTPPGAGKNSFSVKLFIAAGIFLLLFYTVPFLRERIGIGHLQPGSALSFLLPVLGLVLTVALFLGATWKLQTRTRSQTS